MRGLVMRRLASPVIRNVVATLVCASALAFSPTPFAQSSPYTLIHRFHSGARFPIGRLVEGPDGSLYGTTYEGGDPDGGSPGGTIFALRPLGNGNWSFETVHQFRPGQDGANPFGGLILGRDGNFYGLANTRGRPPTEASGGTIFRMSPSGSFTTLYVSRNEDDPIWRLVEASDGNFYGATCHGRDNTTSTIFRITPTGSLTTLHTFFKYDHYWEPFNPIEGYCPITELREAADGFLYGAAAGGGPSYDKFRQRQGLGTLFRIDPTGGTSPLTVLHGFNDLDGARPIGGLIPGRNASFYGTAMEGGQFGKGLVYRMSASGAVTTVHAFQGGDGALPFGSLLRSTDGALYGTAFAGGMGFGTLYRIDAAGFSRLHAFSWADGSGPIELMQGRDGFFYGVTVGGGPGAGGTVYRLGPGNVVTTLHTFAGEPRNPKPGVIQATDGNFYGTTALSDLGGGSVFKLTPSGELTVLHDFGSSRVEPSRLIQASDGFLYGTTQRGGDYNGGIAFRIGTAGALKVLYSFPDLSFADGLVQATDGNFYGTTWHTIFRMDAFGNVTTLHSFPENTFAYASSPLVQGGDGYLYSTGAAEDGVPVLFKIALSGELTRLDLFASLHGLIKGPDGLLYGSGCGGPCDHGGIVRFDPATNAVTTLHANTSSEGYPAPAVVTPDGAIYGWAGREAYPKAQIRFFRLTTTGLTFLYELVDADGEGPSAPILGADGAFYGTVAYGPHNLGTPESWPLDTFSGGVFRLTVPLLP